MLSCSITAIFLLHFSCLPNNQGTSVVLENMSIHHIATLSIKKNLSDPQNYMIPSTFVGYLPLLGLL